MTRSRAPGLRVSRNCATALAPLSRLLFLLLPLWSASASALTVAPVLGLGTDLGGDTAVTIKRLDGSVAKNQVGHGTFGFGGTLLRFSDTEPHAFEAQLTLGFRRASTEWAGGQRIHQSWPLELLSFYRNTRKNVRIGAGLSHQFRNELSSSGGAPAPFFKIKDATWYVGQLDFIGGDEENIALGAKWILMRHLPENEGSVGRGNLYSVVLSYFWL